MPTARKTNAPVVSSVAARPALWERRVNRPPDFAQRLYTLTQAEHRVYDLYSAGYNARQITERLGLSLNTVKTHSRKIFKKLGVNSRRDLLEMKGGDEGWIAAAMKNS
jgi:DNA-binding CsgD family transcriptional regulator